MAWKITQIDDTVDLRHYRKEPNADLLDDFHFEANGYKFRVALFTDTDGSSIPKPLLGVFGDKFSKFNLYEGIIHDAAYSNDILIEIDGEWKYVYLTAGQTDAMFRIARDFCGGWKITNWAMWAGIRLNSTIFDWTRPLLGKKKVFPTLAQFKMKHPDGIILPFDA